MFYEEINQLVAMLVKLT